MTVQGKTTGTAMGTGIALTTNTGFNTAANAATLIGVTKGWEMVRKAIEYTHSLSTNGWAEFKPGDIKKLGEMELMFDYDTQTAYDTFFNAGCDTLTFTHPTRATSCGGSVASVAASVAFSVVFVKLSAAFPFDDRQAITATFQLSGQPTFTKATA